jgi:NADH:ubiquinone oxidoreductase subunit 4 (subunit M)
LIGCFTTNSWIALLAGSGMILGAGYSLWLCNRIIFGNVKEYSITIFKDLTRREFFIFLPFIFLTFLIGLYPDIITNFLKATLLSF